MRHIIPLFVLTLCASAQSFSIGIKGGVPIVDFFKTIQNGDAKYTAKDSRFVFGPTVEVHLRHSLSIEMDALYRPLGYNYALSSVSAAASSWEIPLLLKQSVLAGPIRPFYSGGISFQKITGWKQVTSAILNPAQLDNDTTVGFTFGGGVQWKFGRWRIDPELRYTRWGSHALQNRIATVLATNLNRGDFIIGVTF